MKIQVQFFSYFKDAAGCDRFSEIFPEGTTVKDVLDVAYNRFPKLAAARRSTLVAVGLEYVKPSQTLKDGDEVSLFPPVQGG
jgi:molybdopterin converting factor small subunit